jgi:predicted alpha/beta superfamily hydrolase
MLDRGIPVLLLLAAAAACGPQPRATRPADAAPAAADPVTISKSEVRLIKSQIVPQEFKIFVAHPVAFGTTLDANRKYPVVYTLDANGTFGTVTEAVRMAAFGGELPPALVVGIGYPVGEFAETLNLRMRDYTPTSDTAFVTYAHGLWGSQGGAQSGGAEAFLRFIREELKPFIEKNYPADPSDATLIGHSFGGLFATYALFHHPDTFKRYVISSPSLWWDRKVSFEFEKEYSKASKDLPATVFLSVGGLENTTELQKSASRYPEQMRKAIEAYYAKAGPPEMVELLGPFAKALRDRRYPGLQLSSHVFPDETHMSVPATIVNRGLRVVFGTFSGTVD